MAVLAWLMMGLALWHFMIWLPDRASGGIVGTFVYGGIGAILGGLAINGFSVPGPDDLSATVALEGIPGALIALGAAYVIGTIREPADA